MPTLRSLARYFHTLRYLRLQQIVGRARYHLYRPRLASSNLPRKRRPVRTLVSSRFRPASLTGPNSLAFLNRSGRVVDAKDWNDPKHDKLWLYNLHYFDDLNAHGAEIREEWHRALIRRWIAENPPTQGTGWEPYPVSLRTVNWIKWDLRFGALEDVAINSLALQLRWLRRRLEYHILGNHLLANAKALIFGGLYFEGPEADEWLRTGWRIFEQQLREQVLPDGGHFELSPMYHLIVLEDLLDVINIVQAYDESVPENWPEVVNRMIEWAEVMHHPDGEIPFFNDAAFGIAGTLDDLRGYAERLGIRCQAQRSGNIFLSESGYLRLENEEAVVLVDAGPVGPDYLPGHAHADTLSLEMSLFGKRFLVNSGTSVYGTGPERLRQRGTAAHNTIVVDEADSSEVWGGFRVARRARARILDCNEAGGTIVAEHDGYRRLPGRPVHRRRVHLKNSALIVSDTVSSESAGESSHSIQGAWHLHPDVEVTSEGVVQDDAGWRVDFRFRDSKSDGDSMVRMVIQGADNVIVESTTWHPEFGLSVPNKRIVFSAAGRLPRTLVTTLSWKYNFD